MVSFGFRRSHLWALLASAVGAVTFVTQLPSGLRLVLLGIFLLVGPGSAVVDLLPFVETRLRLVIVPIVGLSAALLLSTLLVDYSGWNPRRELLILIAATVVLTIVTAARGSRRRRHGPKHEPDPTVSDTPVPAAPEGDHAA